MRVRLILITALVALLAAFLVVRYRSPVSTDAQAAVEQPPRGQQGARPGSGRGSGGGPVAVVTAVAKTQDVPVTETSVGWVEPIASVDIRPRIDGVIVARPVNDGDTVKAGDLLFQLDDKALQAMLAKDRAALAKDQANVAQLQADLERLTTLSKHQDATPQQVQQQQAAVSQAQASAAGDQAQIEADQVQIGYTEIRAPISGRVGVVGQSVGALVRTSDAAALLTITQMAPLRISFAVPERDLAAIRRALASTTPAKVEVSDPATGQTLSTGALTFIDSSVDQNSGTVTAKADFANADGALWPGEYLQTTTELGVEAGATVIPLAALQVGPSGSFVYVTKPDGTVAAAKVTVVTEDGDNAVIGAGLKPDDHVVVEGQLRLHDGARIAETVASNDAVAGRPAAAPIQ